MRFSGFLRGLGQHPKDENGHQQYEETPRTRPNTPTGKLLSALRARLGHLVHFMAARLTLNHWTHQVGQGRHKHQRMARNGHHLEVSRATFRASPYPTQTISLIQ